MQVEPPSDQKNRAGSITRDPTTKPDAAVLFFAGVVLEVGAEGLVGVAPLVGVVPVGFGESDGVADSGEVACGSAIGIFWPAQPETI